MWFEAALNNFFWKTKKQRSSCCWWGWWQHWSPSQQHMGRVHGWEHTNASLHGPCASPWLTKSMGNLKQESCHSQTRLTHQPLQDWERRELENSHSKLSGSYGGVNTFFGHCFIFHPQRWFWFTRKNLENQNQRNLSKWFTTQSSGPGRRWPVYTLSAGCAGLIDLDRPLICWY